MINFMLLILIYTGIFALMAIGQNLITGYVGLLSLTQAGFFAIGSYATAILSVNYGINFWVTIPIAALIAAFFWCCYWVANLETQWGLSRYCDSWFW